MKVAFDCKGTLDGGGAKVHKLFKWFESKGCEMIIWSSVYSFAVDAQKKYRYKAEVKTKDDKYSSDGSVYDVDIAVDDDNYIEIEGEVIPTIACNHMILVHKIPDDESEFEEKYGHLIKGDQK